MNSILSNQSPLTKPAMGFGLGLRSDHYQDLLAQPKGIDWLEIISENYMIRGGKPLYYLDQIRELYPIVMHGVSLSIGSTDPLNREYLIELKDLIDRVKPKWISDHLCWTGIEGLNMHDLLPLPYNEEALKHVIERVTQVQDFLGRRILLENLSSYLSYPQSTMTEWEFLREVAEQADCLILLDVNNIHVSAFNHNFNPLEYLDAMPADRIQQIHLAGHLNAGDYIVDTHDHDIVDDVWNLYAETVKRFGHISTMIERDDDIPPLNQLITELNKARSISDQIINPQMLFNKKLNTKIA